MARQFEIVCDTACDIPALECESQGVKLIPFYVSFDGEKYEKEGVDFSVREMYDKMVENAGVYPKTSLPSVQDYVDVLEPFVNDGKAVLCITFTSHMSSAFQSAVAAAEIVRDEHEGAVVVVMDSELATVTEGLFLKQAIRARDMGLDVREAAKRLNELKSSSRIFYTVADLEYLIHGGRIGKVVGIAGSVLKLQPLIVFKDGEIEAAGVSRSRTKATKKLIDLMDAYTREQNLDLNQFAFSIGFGYDPQEGQALKIMVETYLNSKGVTAPVDVYQIGATIGVHNGPYPLGLGMIRQL
ncbi:MAG: DegV family protein [Lachnospiraceae bacterium]|nr:DegV family protein [Lachnospiraceae bacterium]